MKHARSRHTLYCVQLARALQLKQKPSITQATNVSPPKPKPPPQTKDAKYSGYYKAHLISDTSKLNRPDSSRRPDPERMCAELTECAAARPILHRRDAEVQRWWRAQPAACRHSYTCKHPADRGLLVLFEIGF